MQSSKINKIGFRLFLAFASPAEVKLMKEFLEKVNILCAGVFKDMDVFINQFFRPDEVDEKTIFSLYLRHRSEYYGTRLYADDKLDDCYYN